jgi:hypothetical protein
MASVVEFMYHSKGLRLSQELLLTLTEAPSRFSGCLAAPHPDPGILQEHGNQ